jgi:hypothetical protein
VYVSGNLGIEWTSEAYRAVVERGMTPFFYQGLEKAYEGSAVKDEARNDLWECDLIILALTTEEAQQPKALWIRDDVEVAMRRGVSSLAYVYDARSKGTGGEKFGDLVKGVPLISVTSPEFFGDVLKNDLSKMRTRLDHQ